MTSEGAVQDQALPLTFEMIEEARQRVEEHIYVTPCAFTHMLSERTGAKVHLKLENLQMTGSFKERGALNRLLALTPEERERGVVAASAGNHAQGLAYHASRLKVPATIVMPVGSPIIKISRTRKFGATVIEHGLNYDESWREAMRLVEAEGKTLVHAFDDPLVMAGQGTIGLEILDQNPFIEIVVVPVGGGGLISGIAVALKETNPKIKVVGVQAACLCSMKAAIEAGEPVELPPAQTIADGIAVRRTAPSNLALVKHYVDELVEVSEEEIANAILVLLEQEKTVVEGAGATPLAALLHGKIPMARGKKTCLVLSGGNIDVNLVSRIIERGLVKAGRLMRIDVTIADIPGSLARLTALFGALRANILEIYHTRTSSHLGLGQTGVEVTLETRGFDHINEIQQRLRAEGYTIVSSDPDLPAAAR